MDKKVIVVFETLERSKEIVRQIEPSFYPEGTFWLLGFCNGELCINIDDQDSIDVIDEALFGKPDFLLLKDSVLNSNEIEILSKIIGERELYIIYHFRSVEVREANEPLFHNHEKIRDQYKFAINQSHLDGEFYFDELVEILECVQSEVPDKVSKYNSLLYEVIEKRFPDPVLEAKLELLHKCLLPSDVPTLDEFNKKFSVLNSFEDNYKLFLETIKSIGNESESKIYGATDKDVFHPDYIEAIKQLRIDLLGS